jgi:hypothetical protein
MVEGIEKNSKTQKTRQPTLREIVITGFAIINQRLDKIEKTLVEYGIRLDKIEKTLIEHGIRLDKIEDTLKRNNIN